MPTGDYPPPNQHGPIIWMSGPPSHKDHAKSERGWICPLCGKANAPWLPQCPCNDDGQPKPADVNPNPPHGPIGTRAGLPGDPYGVATARISTIKPDDISCVWTSGTFTGNTMLGGSE